MLRRLCACIAVLSVQLFVGVASAGPAFLRHPTGRGDRIVFQFHDKLWRYDRATAVVSPLVAADEEASSPAMSPDGTAVAYVAARDPDKEVFLVSLETGNVRQLTFDGGFEVKVQGWLNETEVLYATTIKSTKRGALLFAVDTKTLVSRPLPLMEASEGCALGDDFIFVKNQELVDAHRKYEGGYAQQIYKIKRALLSGEVPVRQAGNGSVLLSGSYDGASRNPVCLGDRIYFLSDRTGRYNVWSMTARGDDLVQHTFDRDFDIKSMGSLSAGEIVYEKMGEIFVLDVAHRKSAKVTIPIPSAAAEKSEHWSFPLGDSTDYGIANDGKTLVAVSRGKMWAVDVASASATCMACKSGVRLKSPQISPDGKSVVALSDESGEYGIYRYAVGRETSGKAIAHDIHEPIYDISLSPDGSDLLAITVPGSLYHVDVKKGKTRKIELATRTTPQEISWSHDGRRAAFVVYSAQDIGQVAVFDTRCASTEYLSSGTAEVTSPVFSKDDSEVYYISRSNFRSNVIDTWAPGNYWPAYDNRSLVNAVKLAAGSGPTPGSKEECSRRDPSSRLSRGSILLSRELPIVAGNYEGLFLYDGRLHAYSKKAARDDTGQLVVLGGLRGTARTAPKVAIRETVSDYRASQDGSALAFRAPSGLLVMQANRPGEPAAPIPLDSVKGLETEIDLAQERQQMFQELWRLYRDYFWDKDMDGVDWRALREKYVRFLPGVSNRTEFNELAAHMVAELGAGHTTLGNPSPEVSSRQSLGKLGAAFAEDAGLRVVEIYDGDLDVMEERSPLSVAGSPVEIGDRITRVNGLPVKTLNSLDRRLYGRVDEPVSVTVQKPNGDVVELSVSPISAEHEVWLRNKHWAARNGQFVDEASDSRLGYIYMGGSYEDDFANLVRQYAYLHQRSALILDLRGNSGGNIDPWVLHLFQRRTWLYIRDRYDALVLKHPRESFEGQLVVLIDGDTYSDGELIAEGVRRLGLGVLVGTRTSGAGVWVNDNNTLIDGGNVRIPVSGSYAMEWGAAKQLIEGRGVEPDVSVENDPYQFYFSEDAQLRAAVEVALKSVNERCGKGVLGGCGEPSLPGE